MLSCNFHLHNDNSYPEYSSPKSAVLVENIKEFRELFFNFCDYFDYDVEKFHVDESLLVKTFLKTDRQKLRYKIFHGIKLNELKVAGILAYWSIRYKPLIYVEQIQTLQNGAKSKYTTGEYNELFALYLMMSTLDKYSIKKGKVFFQPTESQIKNFQQILFHTSISEEMMTTFLEPIGEMLNQKAESV